jgi:hypothetical protein
MPLVTIADLQLPGVEEYLLRAQKLSKMYDQFIEADPGNAGERAPGIHASEVSGCKRKIVYGLLAYEKRGQISKNWRQRFAVGHALHAMIQQDFFDLAAKSGGLVKFECEEQVIISPTRQPMAKKWFINSSTDGVFTFYDEPGGPPVMRIGLEIKTEAMDGYDKLKAPKPEHLDQAHVYMACLDVPAFWFLYINKNNQNNTSSDGPFLVTWDQRRWDALEKKFQECHDYADKVTLPEKEESMLCQFCAFSYTCQPASLVRPQKQQRAWRPNQ